MTDVTEVNRKSGAEISRDVARNAQGEVKFASTGSVTTATTQTGTPVSTQTSISGRVVHDRAVVNVLGTGNVVLRRDGSTIRSEASVSSVVTSGTPKVSGVNWTMDVTFNSLDGAENTQILSYTNTNTYSVSTTTTVTETSFRYTATGTYTQFYAKFHLENATRGGTGTSALCEVRLDGYNMNGGAGSLTSSETLNAVTTGTFSNSPITFSATVPTYVTLNSDSMSIQINNFEVRGYTPRGSATLAVSKNEVVTVQ